MLTTLADSMLNYLETVEIVLNYRCVNGRNVTDLTGNKHLIEGMVVVVHLHCLINLVMS